MESDEEDSSLEDEDEDMGAAHDLPGDSHDDDSEEELDEDEPPQRTAPPKRKQSEDAQEADDLSAALRQKRDEDRTKGKAVSRQLVSMSH